MLNYGNNQLDKGIILLKVAEKNIVIKSYKYKINGLSPEDIAQELRAKIWYVKDYYDPKRGSMETFTNFVINNCLKNLYRDSKRKKQILNTAIPIDKIKI